MITPLRRSAWRYALPVLVAASLLAACGDDDADSGTATTVTDPPTQSTAPVSTTGSSGPTGAALTNCGFDVEVAEAPARAITMNQGATEIALSLGLADRMVGTAYLDDVILPELAADYESVPVLSAEYPTAEEVLEADPDFVYASYPSAFDAEAAGDRAELVELGIGSYVSPAACPDREDGKELTFDDVFAEFTEVAEVFGVSEAGEQLVAEQKAILEESRVGDGEDVTVFWWDSGLDAPTAGACCGAPAMIMDALGVTNIFDEVEGNWGDVSWEAVVEADPDLIVLIDASWDPAADKQAHLESDPALSSLTAVTEGRFVTLPFSASTPGVRNAGAVGEIAAKIQELGLAG